MHKGHNPFDHLLNEVLQCYIRSDITLKQGNDTEAMLIAVSPFQSLPRYKWA